MLELLFLLLPIAMLYGWYMGARSILNKQQKGSYKLSRDYMQGIGFLLADKQEKALDLFLRIINEKDDENNSSQTKQQAFEATLVLGSIFRQRGELDQALRLHNGIIANEDYSFDQKLLTKVELALDFMAVGFYDRAENIYINLVEEPDFAVQALKQLSFLYQITKEWEKGIDAEEKLIRINLKRNRKNLSHYLCEHAKSLKDTQPEEYLALLNKAHEVDPNSPRPNILLGIVFSEQNKYQEAIDCFEAVLEQNPNFIVEVIQLLKKCYVKLNRLEDFEIFLIKANNQKANPLLDLAIADLIAQKEGDESAQSVLLALLKKNPNIITFRRFIGYQISLAETPNARESLVVLENLVSDSIKKIYEYSCENCGYSSNRLHWCCPSCRRWETMRLNNLLQENNKSD